MKNVITRKITVVPIGEIKETYSKVRFWQDKTFQAYNKAMTVLMNLHNIVRYDILQENVEEKLRMKLKSSEKDEKGMLKKSFQNAAYNVIAKDFSELSSFIRTSISDQVFTKYKNSIVDIKYGNISVPSYKKNCPIPFAKGAIRNIRNENDEIIFDFIENTKFKLFFGKDKSNNREIVNRIISGEYKLCDSSLVYDKKDIYFNIVVSFEKQTRKLNEKTIVGVDLGINIPVAMIAMKEGKVIGNKNVGSRDSFLNKRNAIINFKRRLQTDLVSAKSGHGRKRKLKPLDKYSDYERNWAKNQNHNFSKAIVDFAILNNAGTIKMEDLSGIGRKNQNDYLLKRWSYFELQTFVEYKAKKEGIEVIFIDPRNTSKMCSKCGVVDSENRKKQAEFKCISCGHEDSADINAAINIAKSVKLKKQKEEEGFVELSKFCMFVLSFEINVLNILEASCMAVW